MNISKTVADQKAYFATGATLPLAFRRQKLRDLLDCVMENEDRIARALAQDLGKSSFEGYMCEIGMVRSELSHMLKHLGSYAKVRRVRTPMGNFPSKSKVMPCPYGTVLIMSPWNYPFLLTLGPLIDAIAAGNTAVVKPSAYSPATSALIQKLLSSCFKPEHVAVVTGGRQENAALLEEKFDMIFFTGSQAVGREVLRHAAEHLTPAVLELGGKSPCIVDASAKIPLAARRIVFGKYLNCGQTCVAPDYILCHESVKDDLIKEMQAQITAQFGQEPLKNPDYGKIISQKHFDRLCGLMDDSKTVCGGQVQPEALRIAPTILDNVTWDHKIMQEEIFGPLLPVLTFSGTDEILTLLENKAKPLALYLFSRDRQQIRTVTSRIRYGGGCINDVVVHLATEAMGFGGVGESGMGAYHGKTGFDAFSHKKSILHKRTWLDLPMRYQPYKGLYLKLVKLFLK